MTNQKQNIGKGGTGYQAKTININNIVRNPSILANVINVISKIDLDDKTNLGVLKEAPVIEDKIKHNDIKAYFELINDYGLYGKKLETIYQTLEQEKPGRKSRLLRNISDLYKKEKGKITINNDIVKIRENADLIIENIINKLDLEAKESSNINAENEDIKAAVSIVVADAFIRCKILEDPSEQ
jgi:hypothetical protein